MNVSILELNKKYKNYKELCEVLDEPIKGGKSKQLQLQDWERYFKYTKQGNGFIVTEIYAEPKEKVSNRGKSKNSHGNNNKFAKYTDILIENFLHKSQARKHESIIYITNNCLGQEIKMVNFNYRTCANNRDKFHRYVYIHHPHSPVSAERDVFYYIYSKIKPAIIGGLNRLQEQGKITYKLTYLISREHEIIPMADIDVNSIKEIEENLLEEMGITKKQMMWKHDTKTKFYTELNRRAMEYFNAKEYPIDAFWQGYRIIVNEVKEQKDAKALEKELNKLFIEDVSASIEKAKDKIREKYKYWIGQPCYDYKWEKEKMSLQYKVGCEFAIKVLLSYKVINIVKNIEEMKSFKQLEEENIKLAEENEDLF